MGFYSQCHRKGKEMKISKNIQTLYFVGTTSEAFRIGADGVTSIGRYIELDDSLWFAVRVKDDVLWRVPGASYFVGYAERG